MNQLEAVKVIRNNQQPRKAPGVDPEKYREEIRQLISESVKYLVDEPEQVDVSIFVGPKTTVYKVNCATGNLGQLIGAQGRTIMGLRAVVHAMTARAGIRSIIEIPV
jgi:predicted RNA-binding protein YlqC (UPF0109 family)